MKRALFAGVFAFSAIGISNAAWADVPFFNATCPNHIEVHADEGGPVFLNGSEAKLQRFNSNYFEASQGPTTVSVSVNPDGSVTVSYTRQGSGNGICQVNAHQRHKRSIEAPTGQPELKVSLAEMPRFCVGEASATFDRRPNEITTNMAFRIGKRYVVQGWFDGKRGSTFFNCYFDERGQFVQLQ